MTNALKRSEYYQFVKFIATPLPFRDIKTQAQFQIEYMVSGDTLARWKKDPNFWDDVKREVREWSKEQTPQVLGVLLALCLQQGNVSAIRLWLDYTVKYGENGLEFEEKQATSLAEIMAAADAELRSMREVEIDYDKY